MGDVEGESKAPGCPIGWQRKVPAKIFHGLALHHSHLNWNPGRLEYLDAPSRVSGIGIDERNHDGPHLTIYERLSARWSTAHE